MTKRYPTAFDVWDRLWAALHHGSKGLIVYVYRINPNGKVIKPHLIKCAAWPGLVQMLRDEYGGGNFRLLVKSGRTMKFSGRIAVVETPALRR